MESFLEFIRHVTLSDVGSIISIISFIFTVIMFFDIKSIKKYYFFAARVPEVAQKLKIYSSNITQLRDDFENSIEEVSLELTKVDVVLKSLSRKLDGDSVHFVVALRDKIRDYKPKRDGKEPLIDIYVGIYRILEELDELQKDSKWER